MSNTAPNPTLFIASDHAGFELKSHLLRTWKNGITLVTPNTPTGSTQWQWRDLGPFTSDRVDYPDYAQSLCKQLVSLREAETPGRPSAAVSTQIAPEYKTAAADASQSASFGILICGSGQGMAMTANRFKGIRAALTWNLESTRLSRMHNDANVLCLGARLIEPSLAVNLVETFLLTPFEGGRHTGRIAKIEC